MQFRRTIALLLGAVLAVPLLTSCGFNLATDKPYTPANGGNNRDKTVDVLGAVIVATKADEGTFIATMSNGSTTDSESFSSLGGAEGAKLTAASFTPVEIAPRGYANLADSGGIKVTGTFAAGDSLRVAVGFAGGDSVVLSVPVVTNCNYFEGLDSSGSSPSASASSSADPSASASPSAEASPSSTASPYSCAYGSDSISGEE